MAGAGLELDLPDGATLLRSQGSGTGLESAVLALGDDRLRVRVVSGVQAAKAKALVDEERTLLEDLFGDRQAPYPGQLTNTLRCPETYHPQEVRPLGGALELLTLQANDRLGFGGCAADLLRYRATVGFFHDAQAKRLIKLEYFAALESDQGQGAKLLATLDLATPQPGTAPAPVTEGRIDWTQRFAPDADADPICEGCNLLVISLDIFRADHMECLGHDKATSPRMCEMIEHGTLFENFIVHAYQTPVSQMSLFTGKYPSSSGFVSFTSVLDKDVQTFPEALQSAGYHTVAMGSSFEVMSDMSKGMDGKKPRFKRDDLNPGLSFGRGFDRFIFTGNRNVPTDAIPWLAEHGDEQFFLWLILGSLHWPYGHQGDPAKRDMFDPPGYDGPLAKEKRLHFPVVSRIYKDRFYPRRSDEVVILDDQDSAYINARYDYGLWSVDEFIGDLLDSMAPEVLQNTVIVLHGVHGEDLGEHGYFGHYDIYDTEVRSIAIVLNPKHRVEGQRIEELIEGVDLSPTLLDVLALPPMQGVDGESVSKVFITGKGDPDKIAYFERIPLWEEIFRHRSQMPRPYLAQVGDALDAGIFGDTGLRTQRWKLLHRKARQVETQVSWYGWLSGEPVVRTEWQLYDLQADPDELVDVSAAHPKVLADLQAKLLAWESKHNVVDPP
jgi:arylsulfatase A-like enzyme